MNKPMLAAGISGLMLVGIAGGPVPVLAADTTQTQEVASHPMLPANAHAGECYARVFVPPQHVKETKRVLKREASEKIETVAEKYEWIEKRF